MGSFNVMGDNGLPPCKLVSFL